MIILQEDLVNIWLKLRRVQTDGHIRNYRQKKMLQNQSPLRAWRMQNNSNFRMQTVVENCRVKWKNKYWQKKATNNRRRHKTT